MNSFDSHLHVAVMTCKHHGLEHTFKKHMLLIRQELFDFHTGSSGHVIIHSGALCCRPRK